MPTINELIEFIPDEMVNGKVVEIRRTHPIASETRPLVRRFRINRQTGKVQWNSCAVRHDGTLATTRLWKNQPLPSTLWHDLNSFIEWVHRLGDDVRNVHFYRPEEIEQ